MRRVCEHASMQTPVLASVLHNLPAAAAVAAAAVAAYTPRDVLVSRVATMPDYAPPASSRNNLLYIYCFSYGMGMMNMASMLRRDAMNRGLNLLTRN